MPKEATYRYGDNIQTMDHTPGSDVDAGQVVIVNEVVGIPVMDIPANTLGSLNISGGVYSMAGDAAIAVGKKVWWDDTGNQVSETSTSRKFVGTTVTACSGAGAYCDVAHAIRSGI